MFDERGRNEKKRRHFGWVWFSLVCNDVGVVFSFLSILYEVGDTFNLK